MEVSVTGIVHSFETDYSKRCMSCRCIGMGLVTYYIGLVMILEGICNGNVIWFAIIIETIIVVAGVLGYTFVVRIHGLFIYIYTNS